jgi:putative acetyltransferase
LTACGDAVTIIPGDLDDPRVRALLEHHVTSARAATAPGSDHALDPEGLRAPDITFWAAWDDDVLLGVGALKRLSNDHGEIKSMHTVLDRRSRGVGSAMLLHIIDAARARGMSRLSLETGSWEYFVPARELYKRHGFVECPPFGEYVSDPNSVFMSRKLRRLRGRVPRTPE